MTKQKTIKAYAPTIDEYLDHDSDYWKQHRKQINDSIDDFLRTGKLPETKEHRDD